MAHSNEWKLTKVGLFGMPLHPRTRPIAESYEEDAAKIIHVEEDGFDEVWIGEHMSCTTEPIASPLMFMASLLSRTKHVRFGTGVIALPNHYPAVVAAEVAPFDHLSRGRLMLGIGSDGLASDMALFCVLHNANRSERMMESIDTILRRWRQDPPYRIEGKH